jgi:hypothetical protein
MKMEAMRRKPRIHFFWIKCPAPGMSQPMAGAITERIFADVVADLLAVEFAIR